MCVTLKDTGLVCKEFRFGEEEVPTDYAGLTQLVSHRC